MKYFLVIFPWFREDPMWKKGMVSELGRDTMRPQDLNQNYILP